MWEAQRFYCTHFQTFQANQRHDEAKTYLQKAHAELCRVATQIQEQNLRESFLKNVRSTVESFEPGRRPSRNREALSGFSHPR